MKELNSVFKDLKVLELSSVLAGPLVGSFFAEMGADVVKVENKTAGGDVTRQWKLPSEEEQNVSAYYASANYGKKSIFLDFKDSEDFQTLVSLIVASDIITTNYQKHTAEKLGVDLPYLHKLNPQAIICQLNAYTYEDTRPGYDMVMQADTGLLSMSGTEDGSYVKVPVAIIDVIASHQMKEAILVAMLQQQKDKKGRVIHVSLYKSGISALVNQASNYLMAGHIPKPAGMKHPNIAPYGDIVTSQDGTSIVLAVGSDGQFDNMLKSLNFASGRYAQFSKNSARVESRARLMHLLREDFLGLKATFIVEKLSSYRVPHCMVNNLESVFRSEIAQEMILEDENNGCSQKRVSSIAFDLSFTPDIE